MTLFLLSNDKTIMGWEFILVCKATGDKISTDYCFVSFTRAVTFIKILMISDTALRVSNNEEINSWSELLKAVKTETVVFWVIRVASYCLVCGHQWFAGTCTFALKTEAVCFTETLVTIRIITGCFSPQHYKIKREPQ